MGKSLRIALIVFHVVVFLLTLVTAFLPSLFAVETAVKKTLGIAMAQDIKKNFKMIFSYCPTNDETGVFPSLSDKSTCGKYYLSAVVSFILILISALFYFVTILSILAKFIGAAFWTSLLAFTLLVISILIYFVRVLPLFVNNSCAEVSYVNSTFCIKGAKNVSNLLASKVPLMLNKSCYAECILDHEYKYNYSSIVLFAAIVFGIISFLLVAGRVKMLKRV